MTLEQFNIGPENNYHGDPSLPNFRFTSKERPEMLKKLVEKGMTEDEAEAEIARQEMDATNRQARAKFQKEQRAA
jgi:hypothetical protein